MTEDPRTMSRDELVAHFNGGGDISDLLQDAVLGPDLGPAPVVPRVGKDQGLSTYDLNVLRMEQLNEEQRGVADGVLESLYEDSGDSS